MPLSEHEQQLLDQLEQQLRSDDPRFARNIAETESISGSGLSPKRFVLGVLILLAGLALTILAISINIIPLGVLGFAVMVGGGYWAFSSSRRKSTPGGAGNAAKSAKAASSGSFMNRMEDRWDRRRRGE